MYLPSLLQLLDLFLVTRKQHMTWNRSFHITNIDGVSLFKHPHLGFPTIQNFFGSQKNTHMANTATHHYELKLVADIHFFISILIKISVMFGNFWKKYHLKRKFLYMKVHCELKFISALHNINRNLFSKRAV